MKISVIGFPRIGEQRELKFASEKYFRKEISKEELLSVAKTIRLSNIILQKEEGIDFIPSNDFSFYDGVLDTAVMLNAIPKRYKDLSLDPLGEYFAMARGYQGERGDVKAFAMKKWFNTNYHYMVPEIDDDIEIKLNSKKAVEEFLEAKDKGIITKPVLIGPFTFLNLAKFTGGKCKDYVKGDVVAVYNEVIKELLNCGAEWIQIDEPYLVKDLSSEDIAFFKDIYTDILSEKNNAKLLLNTYFGDIRNCYNEVLSLDFDGIGLDFSEGKETLSLVKSNGFLDDKVLFAGVLNGKNIWKNNYKKTLDLLSEIKGCANNIVIQTSCSLLHVPVTLENEEKLDESIKSYFSFAKEKLVELSELKTLADDSNYESNAIYKENQKLFDGTRVNKNEVVIEKVNSLKKIDFERVPSFNERAKIQKAELNLPLFPTTTIGSFPQTPDVRANRAAFKKGEKSLEEYTKFNQEKIKECIEFQEQIGIDVLVHGEFERNDMVEYFGENLDGYIFTQKAWVQSYGTRCVKPPIVWGDIKRKKEMTVSYSKYAQSLSDKYVKGMLTGPVTILNWSFPREDISLKECAYQIALAIREEVLDLEENGIKIIQIDEAALREKLPLRKSDWHTDYLDWAIKAFRLVHSGVKADTQIHTHMCYSEFNDIIKDIDDMDADVITFEASRSDLTVIDALNEANFKTAVGPGVYDIHSPRVPSVEEIVSALNKMLEKLPKEKLWVNPDCGLKTRGNKETEESLKNMVKAADIIRSEK